LLSGPTVSGKFLADAPAEFPSSLTETLRDISFLCYDEGFPMSLHNRRVRNRFQLETLEGRIALSHTGAVVGSGGHGGQAAEVHGGRHGANDPAGHDVNDDKGTAAAGRGADDAANHDANHDNGGADAGGHQRRGGRHEGGHAAGHN